MKLRYLLFLVSVMFLGCKQEPSAPIDNQLADLYTELVLLSEEYKLPSSRVSPEQYQQKIQEILQKYKTTKEQFTAEIQALSNNQDTFRQFYESVRRKLQDRKGKS